MKTLTVIQARMSSSRLPGKVLLPLAGKALICRMVERVQRAKLCGQVVVAITTDPADDVLEEICLQEGLTCFRGHPLDLLDRHYQAAVQYEADVILKIPSDCPLIDPKIIDQVIQFFLDNDETYDFVSNLHPATYPDGNDVEVMTFVALQYAWQKATKPLEREHTTPYFWDTVGLFQTGNVTWETGQNFSMSHRWTIDYPEDYQFIQKVYEALYPVNPTFGLYDILHLVEQREDISLLNHHLAGVNWYRNHLNELNTIDGSQTKEQEVK